jgi:hypothetical protein
MYTILCYLSSGFGIFAKVFCKATLHKTHFFTKLFPSMNSSQIRQNQQIYLRNMAYLAIFAGEICKRRQKTIFAVGVRGEPSFFICVLNPVKYTDPDGRVIDTSGLDDTQLAQYNVAKA